MSKKTHHRNVTEGEISELVRLAVTTYELNSDWRRIHEVTHENLVELLGRKPRASIVAYVVKRAQAAIQGQHIRTKRSLSQ